MLAKTVRILVLPNITYSKDLEKDSYVQVLRNMILGLRREPIFWHILSPEKIKRLDKPHTAQHHFPVPSKPQVMRQHLDTFQLEALFKEEIHDVDLIMSHLPEQTHQLKAWVWNKTHHEPKVFGYSHWFDLQGTATGGVKSFNQNILGVLEMEKCYINTSKQKELVLDQAKRTFVKGVIRQLKDILTVQNLGIFTSQIKDPHPDPDKVIVFNHRPDPSKDYPHFLKITDALYRERQDFKVWVPMSKRKQERDYITTERYAKEDYYEKLRNCCVGFSPKQTYAGWSVAVATTDGLMNALPYIMYNADYYKEINPTADFFSNDDEALALLNKYLDDPDHRMEMIRKGQQHLRENVWEKEMVKMNDDIEMIVRSLHQTHSPKTEQLVKVIKEEGSISKKDLWKRTGFGGSVKWSRYRRALLEHPNIFDTLDAVSSYNWSETAEN